MEAFPHIAQAVCFQELAQSAAPHNQETGGQQEFLKGFQLPQENKENPELMEPGPWEDPQAFLASFEQVAKACQWPREEWAARLLPALSGEAKKSFSELETRDREDYGKVKAAILQGDAIKMEVQRQRFRQFRYQLAVDPQRIYGQLQKLCHQWLKPERHTKEQILELLILEQFQAILPQEIQNWMKDSRTNTFQAMTLVEDFLSSHQEVKAWTLQEPMQEAAGSSFAEADVPSDLAQGQIYKEAKQGGVGDPTLPSGEIMTQDCSYSMHGLNVTEVSEGDLTEGVMDVKGVAVSLNEVEQTVLDHSMARPMYWEVLEEDYKNVDSLGSVLISKQDAPGQEEIMLIQVSENTEAFLSPFTGDAETDKSRTVLPQQGRNELKKVYHTPKKVTKSKVALSHEEKCESAGPQEGKTAQTQMEYIRLSEGHMSPSETTKHMWVKKLLYSQGGRTCPSGQLGLVIRKMPRKRRKLYPCPICGKTFIQKFILEDHQCVHIGNKLYECPMCGKKFRWRRWVVEHQRVHTGETPYTCSKCGKSFCWRAGLRRHREDHMRRSSCDSACRKSCC